MLAPAAADGSARSLARSATCAEDAETCESCKAGFALKEGVCTKCQVEHCSDCTEDVGRCVGGAALHGAGGMLGALRHVQRTHRPPRACTPALAPAGAARTVAAARTATAMTTRPTPVMNASPTARPAPTAQVRRPPAAGGLHLLWAPSGANPGFCRTLASQAATPATRAGTWTRPPAPASRWRGGC